MEYREYQPHPILQQYVACYWSAIADQPPFHQRESLIPDGTIEFMFNFGDHYFHLEGENRHAITGAHIIGIRKKALFISQPGRQNFFCIRFRIGGVYPFFRLPVRDYTSGFYTMSDLFGNQVVILEEMLFDAKNNEQRTRIADQFLLNRLNEANTDYSFVKKCIPGLLKAPRLEDVLRDFNISYKYLERRFQTVMGLTPKEFTKIYRFTKSVKSMYSGRYDSLTMIGGQSGYYDQSHFIRDFKSLTGYSPKDFLREQFTIVQVIQPALAERLSKLYNF